MQALNDEADLSGFDIALFSAGARHLPRRGRRGSSRPARPWSTTPRRSGAIREIPLVVSEVNPHALERHRGLIANPNCSTMQLMVALAPIHREAGIERLIVATYQSVSGTGKKAIDELDAQAHASSARRAMPGPGGLSRADRVQRDRRRRATSPTATTTPTRSAR